jgi:DNA (cytosine-5)-methyltransferase 1
MDEIAAVRGSNGLKFVSTFSGCGGSCLGFEMAGWLPVYACEFIDEARATYEMNHHGVFVDGRDIRLVKPEEILEHAGLARGELDLLEGSPPCSSFSMAGNREGGWDKVKKYSDKEQRTDDLFFEFVRLVEGLQPKVFVAENVMGLVRGTAKGYFKNIVAAFNDCGYEVEARALDASWLGVPQARQRIIFVGVRKDLGRAPVYPSPLPYRYSIRDAIGDLVDGKIVAATIRDGRRISADEPVPTIMTHGNLHTRSERGIIVAPPGDGPSLVGYALHPEWKKLIPGQQSRRYFNLVRPDARKPIPTITALGGSNPGTASVTHPTEPRKFTIAELKRLSGFPDDFVLTGSYAQQWERIGRAVPPVMMSHVARAIAQGVFDR